MPEHNRKPEGQDDFGLVRNDDVDFTPARRRKGVGPVRLVVSLVLLVAAAITFYVVLKRRLANPEVRVVRNAEDVMDESLAQAHAAGRSGFGRRSKSSSVAHRRAAMAYNKLNDELSALCDCWNGLMDAARSRSGGMDEQLAVAQSHVDEIGRCANQIAEAARSSGTESFRLSRVGTAARNLHGVTRSEYEAFADLAAVAGRSPGPGASNDERAVESDAYNGAVARLEELYERQEALAATLEEEARGAFRTRSRDADDE